MVKVNVEMDEATHKAVKIKAIEEGKAMKEYIVDVLKRAVEGRHGPRAKARGMSRGGKGK